MTAHTWTGKSQTQINLNNPLQKTKINCRVMKTGDNQGRNTTLLHSAQKSKKKTKTNSSNLVAFLCLVVPVRVWKMDVAPCLLHHPLDVVAPFANDVGVLRVGDVHLQSHPVTLMYRNRQACTVNCEAQWRKYFMTK